MDFNGRYDLRKEGIFYFNIKSETTHSTSKVISEDTSATSYVSGASCRPNSVAFDPIL